MEVLGHQQMLQPGDATGAKLATALEPPLSDEKGSERAGGSDVLIARQRWLTQQIARINACLEPVAAETPEAVHHLHAGSR